MKTHDERENQRVRCTKELWKLWKNKFIVIQTKYKSEVWKGRRGGPPSQGGRPPQQLHMASPTLKPTPAEHSPSKQSVVDTRRREKMQRIRKFGSNLNFSHRHTEEDNAGNRFEYVSLKKIGLSPSVSWQQGVQIYTDLHFTEVREILTTKVSLWKVFFFFLEKDG